MNKLKLTLTIHIECVRFHTKVSLLVSFTRTNATCYFFFFHFIGRSKSLAKTSACSLQQWWYSFPGVGPCCLGTILTRPLEDHHSMVELLSRTIDQCPEGRAPSWFISYERKPQVRVLADETRVSRQWLLLCMHQGERYRICHALWRKENGCLFWGRCSWFW